MRSVVGCGVVLILVMDRPARTWASREMASAANPTVSQTDPDARYRSRWKAGTGRQGRIGRWLYCGGMTGWRVSSLSAARARLFIVSYAPLGGMFAARFASQERWWLVVAFGLVALWGVIDALRLVRGASARSKRETTVDDVTDQGAAVSGYLATYLLPFLGNLPQSAGDWIAYGLYFLTAFVVYVRSDLALVNPTLYALGYRVLKGIVDDTSTLLITSRPIRSKDSIEVSGFFDVVVVHRVCHTESP